MSYTYQYPRPSVCVDLVVFRPHKSTVSVLLIKRGHQPFAGKWALPGGFVDQDEDLADAARRELNEETHLEVEHLRQLGAYGKPGRDPRGHTVSVVFLAELGSNASIQGLEAGDDATDAQFFSTNALPDLAFDHAQIVQDALSLRSTSH